MTKFEIGSTFLINGQQTKLYSGAVHYFRIVPSQWRYTLEKMLEAGLNTVETYIPWNMHEPVEGQFDFEGQLDIQRFIELAAELGLNVIVRPSPYICAEWEFGGFPAWLLNYSDMTVRTNTPRFIEKVTHYYQRLFQELVPLQTTHGGPIIMMQVENEYGSFGNDKAYLRKIKSLMQENGVDVPLFTSDGGWLQALESGSLIEDDVFVAANFGGHVSQNLAVLKAFFKTHHKNWPVMCMEFWDGWFNRWGDEIIQRDESDFKVALADLIDAEASFNLYMFRGGTNFGFYNGCSSRNNIDLPQITSYDYDAILQEDGSENTKFNVLKSLLNSSLAATSSIHNQQLPSVAVSNQVRIVDVLDDLTTMAESSTPLSMEQLGSGYGYVFYRSTISGHDQSETLKLVDVADRASLYLNGQFMTTQYQNTLGEALTIDLGVQNRLEILVENMGRVNYGARLLSSTQSKGIRTGVMVDRHFHYGWQQWALDFTQLANIDWTQQTSQYGPTLNRFYLELDEPGNTYVNCVNYGKGIILVNGHNIGKYWSIGPSQKLYLPKDFLKKGQNEIIVMELTETKIQTLYFINNGD